MGRVIATRREWHPAEMPPWWWVFAVAGCVQANDKHSIVEVCSMLEEPPPPWWPATLGLFVSAHPLALAQLRAKIVAQPDSAFFKSLSEYLVTRGKLTEAQLARVEPRR